MQNIEDKRAVVISQHNSYTVAKSHLVSFAHRNNYIILTNTPDVFLSPYAEDENGTSRVFILEIQNEQKKANV